MLIARTDARAVEGLDRALERANRYGEAGADVIFVEAPVTQYELAAVPPAIRAPALVNMVEGGRTPLHRAADLEVMGYSIVIYPDSLTRSIVWTATCLLPELAETGTTSGFRDGMVDFPELTRILGAVEYLGGGSSSRPPLAG